MSNKRNESLYTIDQQRSLLPQFIAAYEDLVMNNPCPLTAAAYIDIIADLFESLIRTDGKRVR